MSSEQRSQDNTEAGAPQPGTPRDRSSLPFEPKKRKKGSSSSPTGAATPRSSSTQVGKSSVPPKSATSDIPEVVNRRMLKRMAAFCGIPTFFGISTFFVSYFITTQELVTLPPTVVLFVSLGFFGLGVIGLSYGALSASWDEAEPGSVLGLCEFQTNFGRLRGAWQEAGEKQRQRKDS